METRKRLAKIVLVFVGCFVFCWFPNHVLYMYRSFNYNEIDPSLGHMIVTLVARVLSFCNSCVNPFALYLLSESFRRHFNSQLCCGRTSYPERSIFITNSAMRSVPNIFISNLAAGDVLLLLTCVPVDASRYFFDEWMFGKVGCKLIPVIQLTSVGVSVFTLTALSADR